jgi:hypothetical protein
MPEKELYTKKDKAPLDIGKCGIILLARVLDVRKHLKLYEKRISAALKNKIRAAQERQPL